MHQEFVKPKLEGERFKEHSIPLELLKDFAALEEMLVEVAKWKFRQQFPERRRGLRNFAQDIELHLAQVEEGSAIPAIVLAFSTLFPPQNAVYFERARTEIIEAIASASRGQVPDLPPNLLSYFDRFGRGLRENEAMVFTRANGDSVSLTPEVRKRLIHSAQVPQWTEEVSLRGRVAEMDQARGSFELELRDGTKLKAPLGEQHRAALLEAFDAYRSGNYYILVQAIAIKDRANHLKEIQTVEHVSQLDMLDVGLRLDELANLTDGWLDGLGIAPKAEHLNRLAEHFDSLFATDLLLPHIYPTAEGGIQAEWSVDDWEVTLEVNLGSLQADYQALNMLNHNSTDMNLELSTPEGWAELENQLRAIGASLI